MPTVGMFGARVKRLEDPRFLLGKALYVDDLKLPGMLSVAFVRSPHAHARIKSIDPSRALALGGVHRILTGEEAAKSCKPIRVEFDPAKFPGKYKPCDFPPLAVGKVAFVGDLVAAVVAENRYLAEDAAELVEVEYEPLPVVLDAEEAMKPGAPLVHEEWGDNIMMRSEIASGDSDRAFSEAAVVVAGRFQMNRHCASPIEPRVVLAFHDPALDRMTVWSSTQMPHMVRTKIADLIDYPEHKLRVISPDVGGGFGLKAHIFVEELVLAMLSRELCRPIKWTEDRRENLYGSYHAKDELCYGELALDKDGGIVAVRARFIGDIGAYTSFPWTPSFEPLQAALQFPGPYKHIHHVKVEAIAVATNKTTSSVYRGVGAPAGQYAMEHLLDMAAAKLKIDPAELRRKNLWCSEDFPVVSVTGLKYDSSTPLESFEKGLKIADYEQFRKQQAEARGHGRYLGIGFSCMVEPTGFGPETWHAMGVSSVSGFEAAHIRVDPNGGVTLSVGTHSHGQGHNTVYAQLVADQLGCNVADVTFIQGDTAATPYGWGTWASRSAVAGGGAVLTAAQRVREKMFRVAAHLLEVSPQDLELRDGLVQIKGVPGRGITLRDAAHAAVYTANVPDDEEPGLEASFYYKTPNPTANATHIAIVEADPATGKVKLLRYIVVEDCGRMINPMIVEAQIAGGVAQGIGAAMLEHLRYDESGQILTTSLMDYLLPSAADVPPFEFGHLETYCPISVGGIKGMGEGGAIASPVAVANAVSDALAPFGWKPVNRLPMTPELVHRQASA
jgi:carbon-monoxide dehydrogenase large subunit